MPRLWYVHRGDMQRGPFPVMAIVEDALLGRLAGDAEVSADRLKWLNVAELRQLATRDGAQLAQASVQPRSGARWSRERDQAAHRWADARSGADRRREAAGAADPPGGRRGLDRRANDAVIRRHTAGRRLPPATDYRMRLGLLVGGLFLALSIGIAGALLGPVNPIEVDLGVALRPVR